MAGPGINGNWSLPTICNYSAHIQGQQHIHWIMWPSPDHNSTPRSTCNHEVLLFLLILIWISVLHLLCVGREDVTNCHKQYRITIWLIIDYTDEMWKLFIQYQSNRQISHNKYLSQWWNLHSLRYIRSSGYQLHLYQLHSIGYVHAHTCCSWCPHYHRLQEKSFSLFWISPCCTK